MDHPLTDFATARNLMVDGQVRPNKVTDRRIIDAMRRIPREHFLPPALAPLAYSDDDVALPGGRFLTEPMVIARLIQTMDVRAGERVLVVAAGTGYAAALLAASGATITALEEDPTMLAIAGPALAEHAPGVALVSGPLAEGWKQAAPYDVILIDGAVAAVPDAIAAQLTASGRLVTVIAAAGRTGQAVLGEPSAGALRLAAVFDATTKMLPSLRPAPAFVF